MSNTTDPVKKARAKNLTPTDIELLSKLVYKYKHVVENKKTDGVTVKQKFEAWKKISEEFCASASSPRTAEQLRNFYKNTKSNLKKELATERADIFRTGGDSAQTHKIKNNPLLQIVQREITPLSNVYDSSSTYFNDEPQPSTSQAPPSGSSRYEECYAEFIRLGGDPQLLQDAPLSPEAVPSSPIPPTVSTYSAIPPTLSPTTDNHSISNLPRPISPTVPTNAPSVIRNSKRTRVNFDTLRTYVSDLGDLKKRKYELQNELLELQIQKIKLELHTPQH